jgi:hypothetical protein
VRRIRAGVSGWWHRARLAVEARLSGVSPIRASAASPLGLLAPNDFPDADHDRLNRRVGPRQPGQPDIYAEYAGGSNGVAYRFFECAQNDGAFQTWFSRGGPSPVIDLRYRQETHLFYFFVAGLASIESFSYMAYTLAAFIDPANFPLVTPAHKRAITPALTVSKYNIGFPGDKLTLALDAVIASQEYIEWSATRNVLAHRISPARAFFVGGPQHGTASWMGLGTLDAATTRDRRTWLAAKLADLVGAAADFADARL